MKNHLFNIPPRKEEDSSGLQEMRNIENCVIDAISPYAKKQLFMVRESALLGEVVNVCLINEFFTIQVGDLTVQQMVRIVDERVYAESGTLPRRLKLFFREDSVYLTKA